MTVCCLLLGAWLLKMWPTGRAANAALFAQGWFQNFIIIFLNWKWLDSIDRTAERSLCPITCAQNRSSPSAQRPAEFRPRLSHILTPLGVAGLSQLLERDGWRWERCFLEGEIRHIETFSFMLIRQKRILTLARWPTSRRVLSVCREPAPSWARREGVSPTTGRAGAQQKRRNAVITPGLDADAVFPDSPARSLPPRLFPTPPAKSLRK